jgi:squalene synthase HpnD
MIPLSYPQAIEQVKAQVAASRTSFRAGMVLLPKDRREGMYALYAFCRAVDDIADESLSPEIAARELQAWRVRIKDVFKGKPSCAITTALLPAIAKFDLIEKDFQEIIDGMEMDSAAIVAPDLATLDLYCDRVASAVGRISVRIFGAAGPDGTRVAHHLGHALQLTNILRDLPEDAGRKRLYLPRELLEKHGIASRDPSEVLKQPQLPALCRELAALARDHYAQADAFMKKCPAASMRPARIMRNCYGAIFDRLVKEDWRNLAKRATLSPWEKIFLILKGYWA